MDKRLFSLFEDELFNGAKRIVPLVYNEKELTKFNTKKIMTGMMRKIRRYPPKSCCHSVIK